MLKLLAFKLLLALLDILLFVAELEELEWLKMLGPTAGSTVVALLFLGAEELASTLLPSKSELERLLFG